MVIAHVTVTAITSCPV